MFEFQKTLHRKKGRYAHPKQWCLYGIHFLVTIMIALPAFADDRNFDVIIEGSIQGATEQELRALSALNKRKTPVSSLIAARRLADRDARVMQEYLQAKGFYAAGVYGDAVRREGRIRVSFRADPGPVFQIDRYFIQYTESVDAVRPDDFKDIGVTPDGSPSSVNLKNLETDLINWLRENGYPQASASRHFVQANFKTGRADAVFQINSGAQARFGTVVVNGTEITHPDFIRKYRTWDHDAVFTQSELTAFRKRLIETGLFSEVSVSAAVPEEHIADVIVNVRERKRRSIGFGTSFATDVGAGGQIFWENRNLFGGAEKLSATTKVSAPEQELAVGLSKPLPERATTFNGTLAARNEESDAFDARTLAVGGALSKTWFDKRLEGTAGGHLNYSAVDDAGISETFVYATLPVSLSWNSDDNILDPTSGFRSSVALTPFVGDASFVQLELKGATRKAFGEQGKTVVAARAAIGSSFGIARDDIPAVERFYAGGGGSIRGFAYQEAGPLDSDMNPVGGASIAEINLETRYKLLDKIQLAAFVDAGSVSDNDFPNFAEEAFVGAGLGVRYTTPLGPFRIDVATPVNGRSTDQSVQVYVALGQPF